MPLPTTLDRCGKCGTDLARNAAEGLCPTCLLLDGMEDAVTGGSPEPIASPTLSSFGDYQLLAEIARGGMGVVYKARQVSLNRIVAVKRILRGPLAQEAHLRRFRAEAELAARLQHPNIVAIHEVGEEAGEPFFSMDYVEGHSLAELAHNQPLPAKRAATYLKIISEAVAYAHSKGVLHRDLKPSNILIDEHDQPRVTDFGLAKRLDHSQLPALNQPLTLSGQVLGSPNFMPPEQAAGEMEAVRPASDVYSLGAVLYQLVTGRAPFIAETITLTLRLVAEAEPTSPRLLDPAVPLDLETICLKCLQKAPSRRYDTAQALADDLARFLQDKPILARPVSSAEKVWRWCRRNPSLAGTLATAGALLLIVAIGSPIAAFRIRLERTQAEAGRAEATIEASKSRQVAQFLEDMLKGVGPSAALGRDTTMLRGILDETANRLSRDLTNQPAVEAELRATIGQVYTQLGQYREAEAMQRRALALHRRLVGNEHPEVAKTLNRLAAALEGQYKWAEAESLDREALAIQRRRWGNEHVEVAYSLNSLGVQLAHLGRPDEASQLYHEALAIRRKLLGNDHRDVALTLSNLGALESDRQPVEAEKLYREALAILHRVFGDAHPDLEVPLDNLAIALSKQGKFAAAETVARQALALQASMLGVAHPHRARSLGILAGALEHQGKLAEAEPLNREALALKAKTLGYQHADTAISVWEVYRVLQAQGKLADAEAFARDQLVKLREAHGDQDLNVSYMLTSLAYALADKNRLSEAETPARDGLAIQRKLLDKEDPSLLGTISGLSGILDREGKWEEAEQLLREWLTIQEKRLGSDHVQVVNTHGWLNAIVAKEGKTAQPAAVRTE
jgi:serine/threonine protein kinase